MKLIDRNMTPILVARLSPFLWYSFSRGRNQSVLLDDTEELGHGDDRHRQFPFPNLSGREPANIPRAGFVAPFALGLAGQGIAKAAETAKAKSILLIWLGGGPSHLDLFDPKPKAPAEYRGPFSTIATRNPGVRFTELVPKLAARSHKFSLIRSNVNFHGGHREAGSIALTGADAEAKVYPPNFGSIVARQRGHDGLPRFISLARGPIGDGVGPIQGPGRRDLGPRPRSVPDRV